MTKLSWGETGERFYEGGIDRGVLYDSNHDNGVSWNGLTSVAESPVGGEPRSYYLDGINYLNVATRDTFEATISAFYSPPEFDACDGSVMISRGLFATQQRRKSFGLSYRTKVGNDVDGLDHGYKIHLIYNALASPSARSFSTLTTNPEAAPLSWKITTKAISFGESSPTAHLIVDTLKARQENVIMLEDMLYGTDSTIPHMPLPQAVLTLFNDEGFVIDGGPVPEPQPDIYDSGFPTTVQTEVYIGGWP